jgi:hypothetical protein
MLSIAAHSCRQVVFALCTLAMLVMAYGTIAHAADQDDMSIPASKIEQLVSGRDQVPAQELLGLVDEILQSNPDKYKPAKTCRAGECSRSCSGNRLCSCVSFFSRCHCSDCR